MMSTGRDGGWCRGLARGLPQAGKPMKGFSKWLAGAALGLSAPAESAALAYHCAFDLRLEAGGVSATDSHHVLFIVETGALTTCIVDDLPAGNAGGAVDVARLYDSLSRPGAHARPYCVPGRRFGSFPSVAQAGPVGADRIFVRYRFLADGSGLGFDVALPSLEMRVIDLPEMPSGYSGAGRCRRKGLPDFEF